MNWECRECGCEDLEVLHEFEQQGDRFARCECNFCGTRNVVKLGPADVEEVDPQIYYQPAIAPACPKCNGETEVTSTQRPTRHHKCLVCSHSFKSTEKKFESNRQKPA